MALIDKETIYKEIERRLKRENEILWNAKKRGTYPSPSCEYNLLTLTSLRDFLDTLPEQVNGPSRDQVGTKFAVEGLEEAAHNFALHYDNGTCDGIAQDCFIAGAEWKYQKDRGEFAKIKAKTWCEGFDACKEQMLEDAVEGEVMLNPYPTICLDDCKDYDFKDGNKVRIIIVKEELK